MYHFHIETSQISNLNSSAALQEQFLIYQGQYRLAESLKEQKVASDETQVSFNVSSVFNSIPVPLALEVINRKFMEHIDEKRS